MRPPLKRCFNSCTVEPHNIGSQGTKKGSRVQLYFQSSTPHIRILRRAVVYRVSPPPFWRIFKPTHWKDVLRWTSSTSQPRAWYNPVMRSPERSLQSTTQLPSVRHGLSLLPMNSYLDGMRLTASSNPSPCRGRKEMRDGRTLRWEKARQMKAGSSDLSAIQPFPLRRKAWLGSLPSLNDEAESSPIFLTKSISSMTGESGGTEAEERDKMGINLVFMVRY